MMDERERLGRVVRGFAPPDDAFERLIRRGERKQRNRRIRAGAIGVIVTVAIALAFVRSVTSSDVPANLPVEPTPAPPVLSGALAYVLDGHIYVADADGSDAVAVADVGAIDDQCQGKVHTTLPSWSPDGRYLAFFADCVAPTRRDVVIADLNGNVLGTFRAQGYRIAWSPDSTRVAVWDEYSWDEGGVGRFTIGIYRVDGTRETQLAVAPGWDPSSGGDPIWTPDGASLLVNQLEVPLDGGTPGEVPFREAFRARPGGVWVPALAYSPDGSQVAYGTRDALMVARADGSEPREVLGDVAITATWSPTGELIAVASHPPGGGTAPNGVPTPNQLRLVDVTTGSSTLLFEGEPGTWFTVIGFSPEGDRILFGEHRTVSEQPTSTDLYSLWSVGVDGSDAREIVVGTNDGVLRST